MLMPDYRNRITPGARFTPPARHPQAQPRVEIPQSLRETAAQPVLREEPGPEAQGTQPPSLKWTHSVSTDPLGAYGGNWLTKFVRTTAVMALEDWGVPHDAPLTETVKLVLTELVTNAVKASLDPATVTETKPEGFPLMTGDDGHVASIIAGLSTDGRSILISVWDEAPGDPEPVDADLDDENGRGLMIIDALCEAHGWCPAKGHGKYVWALINAEAGL